MKYGFLVACFCITALQAMPRSSADTLLPKSDPANTGNWTFNESVSDEFDGRVLDLKKWNILGRGPQSLQRTNTGGSTLPNCNTRVRLNKSSM